MFFGRITEKHPTLVKATAASLDGYPPVNFQKTMENHHAING